MAKSFRLDAQLEARLEQAADMEGVPVSALIREAVEERCSKVLKGNLRTALGDIVGSVDGGGGRADRTGEAFTKALVSRKRR
ncbi:MAG: ribbon-helix-helix protein, CopG family [Actinomycetota bacterium]